MDDNTLSEPKATGATFAVTPEVLDAYFRSIENPFRETRQGMAEDGGTFKASVVFVFVFSLIPLIPYVFARLATHVFDGRSVSFWRIRIPLASFWVWWIVSFLTSLLFLIATFKFVGASKEKKAEWLSPQQMRFAHCYGIVREIVNYRTNHLSRHIDVAAGYVEKVATSLLRAGTLQLAEGVYPEQYLPAQIELTESQAAAFRTHRLIATRPYWYRLAPETEEILSAFGNFLSKLRDRIHDRKDLTIIESALRDLATYFYTEVPEISDGTDENDLQSVGMTSLVSFAQKLNNLPSYQSEQEKPTPEESLSRKVLLTGRWLSGLFNHENLLISFMAWYLFFLLLFGLGFHLALGYAQGIKVDSTVITAIVGGPIATAIAAVTIPRVSKKK